MSSRVLRERAKRVLDLYRRQGMRVATAESCTGGLVATALTAIAGSSDVFECSFCLGFRPPRFVGMVR
jgi:nicotinamide-nucleotide amidase